MHRRLVSLLLITVVSLAGLVPLHAAVPSGMAGHACCRMMHQAPASHDGCPVGATAKMSCCAPTPHRTSDAQVPPASTTASHQPSFSSLKGHAAHIPELPALVASSATEAFESSRLKLPHDALYLRNLVLLV